MHTVGVSNAPIQARGLPRWHGVRNPPASAGDPRNAGSIPGSERAPGVGIGTCSSILAGKIPWKIQATVDGVTKSQTRMSTAHTH